MGRLPNRQIVQELKEGNLHGCRHLMEAYQDRLLSEAVHVFHVPASDAEELVSDVLMAVVEAIESFEFKKSDADFHFWVLTIFKNRVRDFVRRQALTKGLMERFDESAFENEETFSTTEKEVVNAIVRSYQDSLRDGVADPENIQVGANHVLDKVAEVLDAMEAWERVLLRCRALDVPYEEIAYYTGKPVKQLKVYHKRVKEKFVKLLVKECPEIVRDDQRPS